MSYNFKNQLNILENGHSINNCSIHNCILLILESMRHAADLRSSRLISIYHKQNNLEPIFDVLVIEHVHPKISALFIFIFLLGVSLMNYIICFNPLMTTSNFPCMLQLSSIRNMNEADQFLL